MFYHTNNEKMIELLDTKKSSLIYFNNGNYTSHFEQEFTYEKIKEFIEGLDFKTTYYKFDDEVIESIFMKKKPTLFFFRNRYINTTLMFEKKRLPQIIMKMVRFTYLRN